MIHACLGCALRVGDRLVGALTADAPDPHALGALDPGFLKAVSALAGARMQTADHIMALREAAPEGKPGLLVTTELRMNTSAPHADAVLPAANWYAMHDLDTTRRIPVFAHGPNRAILVCLSGKVL